MRLRRMSASLLRCFIVVLPLLAAAFTAGCGDPPAKLARRLGNQQAEGNVRAMVKLARSRGIEVMLIGTPEPGFTVTPPAFYAGIAKEFRLPYEEGVIGEVLRDSSLKSDQIHPNARGYRVIAERVAADLRKSGAI